MDRLLRTMATVSIGAALIGPATAEAAITLGQVPDTPASLFCFNQAMVQTSVTSGPDYRVPPGGGVITRWDTRATAGPGQFVQLIIWDGDVSNSNIKAVAASELVGLTSSALNSNPTRIPVAGGERLGMNGGPGTFYGCGVSSAKGPGDRALIFNGVPPIGGPPMAGTPAGNQRIPVSAVLEADSDKDTFGDESQDSCPIDGSIQVPCAAAIDSSPKKKAKSKKALFSFSVPAGTGISFECALDKGDFAPCASPAVYKKLKPRKHTFQVRAKDGLGQIGAAAVFRWRVTG